MKTIRAVIVTLSAVGAGLCVGSQILEAPPVFAGSAGYSGRTFKTGGSGCQTCHGSANAALNVALSGPNTLYPGQVGTYAIAANPGAGKDGLKMGIDVAASDTGSLSVVSGEPTIVQSGEITHATSAGNLKTISSGSASYQFKYTMPSASSAGSTHTLYGVAEVGPYGNPPGTGSYQHAANFTVTAVAPPAPSSLTATNPTSLTIDLTWAGTTLEFRVISKVGASATFASPSDGTFIYEGNFTSLQATGLAGSTAYTFAVFGKASGASTYSTTAKTVSATTSATVFGTRYVDRVNGSGDYQGNNCLTAASPCQTITYAMSQANAGVGSGAGDTISVAPGTYTQFCPACEFFPITMKSGVKLVSTGGAEATIIDATAANTRVFDCNSTNSETLIEGFTITGGLNQPTVNGGFSLGGGISISGDQIKISRNIIKGNEARGFSGTVSTPGGGQAFGGGIFISGGSPTIVNNVFSGNIARGGAGVSNIGTSTPGGGGQSGQGGAIATFSGTPTIINNTFYGNSAIGGAGGGSDGAGGNGGNGSEGAVSLFGGTIANNVFGGNTATGGTGGAGSPAGVAGTGIYPSLQYSNATATNNLFAAVNGDTVGSAFVIGDPRLHSPSNWHLRYTSPAIGGGTATGAPAIDFDGTTRPNPPSIGAYQAATLTPTQTATVTNPGANTSVALGSTGVTVNFSSFSTGGSIIADYYSSGRTGTVPTSNASAYFWTVATTASTLSGTVSFDFTGKGVGNPSTVKLLRRAGSGRPWAEVTSGVTRSGNTISATVTGFSDFALGAIQTTTTTALAATPNAADAGHLITLTASITPASGPVPTGTVTFFDGSTTLGTAPLGAQASASLTLSGCNEATACLHAGSHSLTATYSGDASYAGSTGTLSLTVVQDTTTTSLVASPSSITFGQTVTLSATTLCHSGSPQGTVTFLDGVVALGSAPLTANVATLSVATLGVGTHSLTARYDGSGDFLPSTSAVLTQVVNSSPTLGPVSVSNVTASTADLSGSITSDGGSTITERGIVYSLTTTNANPLIGGTGVTKSTVTGTTGLFTSGVIGLQPASGYSFKAYATNALGTSYTSVATFTTTTTVPGAPTIGTATAGDATVSVTFAVPTSNGGSAITGYTATCGTKSASGTASPITVTGLTNGTAVTCTVVATNAIGNSAASAASNSVTPAFTGTAIPRLVNISTRGPVGTGDNIMIGGFIIGGSAPKKVVITGRGPFLADFNVPNTLADPTIRLFAGAVEIASNDNWQSATNVAEITASGFAPTKTAEAAIMTTVSPGVPYTVHLSGVSSTTGIALVEVFESDKPEIPLLNISTRGTVLTGDAVLIGGFIIQGSASQRVLITAKGPSLGVAPFNVPGALADTTLEIYQAGVANPIETNDNWGDSANVAAIQATGNAPTSPFEAAIIRTLAPGAYTAIVRGKNGAVGVGLVEVYAK